MISVEQERKVEEYLLMKKLSHNVLMEVKDHFLCQISEAMQNNKWSFYEAFAQIEMQWQYELEMVKADIFSFRKIARIEKKILQTKFKKIVYSSLLFSGLLGSSAFISEEVFFYSEMLVLLFFVFILMYNFIWKKMSFREYQQMSLHPLLLRNIGVAVLVFPIVGYFSGTFDFWKPILNQLVILYSVIVQIQLLYFRAKKINVLLS
ncbi:hypothetical protein PFY12_07730 [Chryseobacterium camelliae]|uniref:Uncharacterized protein n=1 Tax=Chryseobacterium camelliae TaxID=1265445 RepID=A0ABY7QQR3_9FLAO|nr:hypothetical protein [Chryseobacterium camelliae]WBV61999.1 hypothetical protein PFY12_07730 [Chryseobacterium camelliae]